MSDRGAGNRRSNALFAPLVVAAVLAGAAVITVEHSGCDEPARYVSTSEGVQLVGGCVTPHDVTRWDESGGKDAQRG